MATKDFIYDLLEGLEKNGDDYILILPRKTAEREVDFKIKYSFEKKDDKFYPVDSLMGTCESLQHFAEEIAEENEIDFDDYINKMYGLSDDDDDDDEQYDF